MTTINLKMAFFGVGLVLVTLVFSGCGREGMQGPAGASITGATGAAGVNGINAAPCTVQADTGGALITCPGGTTSQINNGAVGASGASGTIITSVQFCTGYTPSYPNTFPEIGMCAGGVLYGVYDGGANDVFATELPPGEYMSTSTGAPCNFTISAGCVVKDN